MSAPASPAEIHPEPNTQAQVQAPQKPTWKVGLLVAALVGAPLAFGVYAAMDPAGAKLLSIIIEYSNYLYLAATLLAAAGWISAKLFGKD